MITLDMLLAGECNYSAASPACLVPSADVGKGGINNKHKQLALKVGTKSQGQNKQNPIKHKRLYLYDKILVITANISNF